MMKVFLGPNDRVRFSRTLFGDWDRIGHGELLGGPGWAGLCGRKSLGAFHKGGPSATTSQPKRNTVHARSHRRSFPLLWFRIFNFYDRALITSHKSFTRCPDSKIRKLATLNSSSTTRLSASSRLSINGTAYLQAFSPSWSSRRCSLSSSSSCSTSTSPWHSGAFPAIAQGLLALIP